MQDGAGPWSSAWVGTVGPPGVKAHRTESCAPSLPSAPPGRVPEAPRSLSYGLQGCGLSWLLSVHQSLRYPPLSHLKRFSHTLWKGSLERVPPSLSNQGLRTTKAGPVPSREPRTSGQSCAFLGATGKYGCLSLCCESVQEETRQALESCLAFQIASQAPWMFFPLLSCLASRDTDTSSSSLSSRLGRALPVPHTFFFCSGVPPCLHSLGFCPEPCVHCWGPQMCLSTHVLCWVQGQPIQLLPTLPAAWSSNSTLNPSSHIRGPSHHLPPSLNPSPDESFPW